MRYEVSKIDGSLKDRAIVDIDDETGHMSVIEGPKGLIEGVESSLSRGAFESRSYPMEDPKRPDAFNTSTVLEKLRPGTFGYRCKCNFILRIFGYKLHWDTAAPSPTITEDAIK